MKKKPVLAVTLGDVSGIGPEIVLKALSDPSIHEQCRPLVVGDAQALALGRSGGKLSIRPIRNPAQARYRFGTVDVLHLPSPDFTTIQPGKPNAATGAASELAVRTSVELALTRLVDGVVHAPISKGAWKQARVPYPGHTELIAEMCNVKTFAMAIAADPLRTVMVTRHIPLAEVSRTLKARDIETCILLAADWMRRLGVRHPRIGVCGLNPHAGESGLIGMEEKNIVAPAILRAAKRVRAELTGPLPADSAYRDHRKGRYDVLITLYHDQSLIPLKLFAGEKLVNITLGLPFPRTSPGHGTAFDIAGLRRAHPGPMKEAIRTAAQLCRA